MWDVSSSCLFVSTHWMREILSVILSVILSELDSNILQVCPNPNQRSPPRKNKPKPREQKLKPNTQIRGQIKRGRCKGCSLPMFSGRDEMPNPPPPKSASAEIFRKSHTENACFFLLVFPYWKKVVVGRIKFLLKITPFSVVYPLCLMMVNG